MTKIMYILLSVKTLHTSVLKVYFATLFFNRREQCTLRDVLALDGDDDAALEATVRRCRLTYQLLTPR